ncbi:MAG: hypothetical protein RIB60_00065 [Phycisphaerales bacterium]
MNAICPWCKYDLASIAPDDGTITCPECGRTCTPIEAEGAARARAERPAAFTREAILGGTVGMALTAFGAFVIWVMGIRTPWIVGLDLGLWALSAALGTAGCFVAAHRTREEGSPLWMLAAFSAVLGWIAAVHAVVAVIVAIVIAARV